MSIAQFAPAAVTRGSSRWLLLCSLALNLFFVGVAVAMAIRTPSAPTWNRDVFVRIERIAATLPPADADLLRGEVKADKQKLEAAQSQYFAARQDIHTALRSDAFKCRRHARGHGQDPRRAAEFRSDPAGHLRRRRV